MNIGGVFAASAAVQRIVRAEFGDFAHRVHFRQAAFGSFFIKPAQETAHGNAVFDMGVDGSVAFGNVFAGFADQAGIFFGVNGCAGGGQAFVNPCGGQSHIQLYARFLYAERVQNNTQQFRRFDFHQRAELRTQIIRYFSRIDKPIDGSVFI